MRPYKVYTSGPMTNLTAAQVNGWRDELAQMMEHARIEFFSPLRHKPYLKTGIMKAGKYGGIKDTPGFILGRDFNDVITSDIVVVNFTGVRTYSNGTSMEMAWAYDRHIPIILIGEEDNPNIYHPMVSAMCGFKVKTLDEAAECIRTILFP